MKTLVKLKGSRASVEQFANLLRGIHKPLQVSRIGPLADDHFEVVLTGPESYATETYESDFGERARAAGCEILHVQPRD